MAFKPILSGVSKRKIPLLIDGARNLKEERRKPNRITTHDSITDAMIMFDGMIVDARSMPREVQEIAYEKRLIPYIPNGSITNGDL